MGSGFGSGGPDVQVPYAFDPAVEKSLVVHLITNELVWTNAAPWLDPERMGDPAAGIIVGIAKTEPTVPGKLQVMTQRLRERHAAGKLKAGDMLLAFRYLEAAVPTALDSAETLRAVTPTIKRHARMDAVGRAADLVAQNQPIPNVGPELERIEAIGELAPTREITLAGDIGVGKIDIPPGVLPTGVAVIDAVVMGLARARLTCLAGDPGTGKTMLATNIAAGLVSTGRHVAFASLEMEDYEITARVLSAMLGIETREVITDLAHQNGTSRTRRRYQRLTERASLGRFSVRKFQPLKTTLADIYKWVDGMERCDLLVIDYDDKVKVPGIELKPGTMFEHGNVLYTDARARAIASGEASTLMLCQARTKSEKERRGRPVALGDLFGSSMKGQISDLVITPNVVESKDKPPLVFFYFAKNRYGPSYVRSAFTTPLFSFSVMGDGPFLPIWRGDEPDVVRL